jgi:hypothetical protein
MGWQLLQVLESSMEIDLYWHQKRTNNKWSDDLPHHLMVDLEVIIALASMRYIVNLDAHELHPGDEKVFNNFLIEC